MVNLAYELLCSMRTNVAPSINGGNAQSVRKVAFMRDLERIAKELEPVPGVTALVDGSGRLRKVVSGLQTAAAEIDWKDSTQVERLVNQYNRDTDPGTWIYI